jgi:hypothetical protein
MGRPFSAFCACLTEASRFLPVLSSGAIVFRSVRLLAFSSECASEPRDNGLSLAAPKEAPAASDLGSKARGIALECKHPFDERIEIR